MAKIWRVVDVRSQQGSSFIDKLADLSYRAFRAHSPNWLPTVEAARDEVIESLGRDRLSRALVDTAQEPVGWVGVIPHSSGRVWEIHPIAVRPGGQNRGSRRLLIEDVEQLAQSHGVPITKCLARSGVEPQGNRIELSLRVAGEVGPPRQILAQQAVGVLIGPALPRTLGSQKNTCTPVAIEKVRWAAAKHGGRGQRGWKKLHLGVDRSGVIVAHTLTEATVDDATTGIGLIEALEADIGRVTADAAYDTIAFYDTATARGATVVVPPNRTARVSRRRPRSRARDRTIKKMKKLRRRRWKKASVDSICRCNSRGQCISRREVAQCLART